MKKKKRKAKIAKPKKRLLIGVVVHPRRIARGR
jgi:hypothetical protein